MSSTNDSPSTDNNAGKEDGVELQILSGHEITEEYEEEDSHSCGKCQKTFTSLELYLQHKLQEHKYSVRYNKSSSSRMIVPHLYDNEVKRPVGRPRKDQSQVPVKPKESGEAKFKRVKRYHPEAAIVDELQGYNCQECGKTFRRAAALRRHMDYDHAEKGSADEDEPEVIDLLDDDEEDEYKQEESPERPAKRTPRQDPDDQQEHVDMITTSGVLQGAVNRPFGCKKCGRRFKEYPVLRTHMLTHTDVREFKCTYAGCPYAFKTKGSLKRHERRHTDDRPFRCELCDRTFRESGALTRHLKSRTLCTSKTNADLPRYGKLLPMEPVHRTQKIQKAEGGLLAPGEIPAEKLADQAVVLLEGDQIIVQCRDGNVLNANNVLSVVKDAGGETMYVLPQESEYDPNQCKACGAVCESVESLEKHLKEHLIHLPFRCGLCSFAVPTRDRLNAHMKAEHDTELPTSSAVVLNDVPENDVDDDTDLNDKVDEVDEVDEVEESEATAMTTVVSSETDVDIDQMENNLDEVIVMSDINAEDMTVTVDGETIVMASEVAVETNELEESMVGVSEEICETIMVTETGEIDQESIVTTVGMEIEDTPQSNAVVPLEAIPQLIESTEGVEATEEADPTIVEMSDDLVDSENVEEQVNEAADVALKQLIHILKYGNEETKEEGERMKQMLTVHKCTECGRCFETQEYLVQHMKIHEEIRPFTCETCHKSFYTQEVLDRHEQMHNVDKRFECGECGKLFRRIAAVKEHFKSHSNERPFACHICFKAFKSANSRKVHLRTHTNLLPYTCEFCMRSFREKSSLDRHTRVHTGERPFQCPHCDKKFSEHGTLARHLRAKIPCCKRLEEAREMRLRLEQSSDSEQQTIPPEIASLVREGHGFNYIIQTDAAASDNEVDLEYVMMTDEDSGNIQNIEIITEGQESLDMSAFPPGTELVLVNSDGSSRTVTMINSETGQEFNVLQSSIEDVEEPVTIVDSSNFDSDIHSIAMVPDVEDHVETVAMDFNQIEAVAMAPDDTVQQAMIAADVQVAAGEVIL